MADGAMHKVVFLDRDGTINEEMGYINHEDRFKVFDFVPSAVRILNGLNYKVIIITNQSGVARGYFTEELLSKVHRNLIRELNDKGAHLDKIYYCPHHPSEGVEEYRKDCNCRKPKTGMIELAKKDFDINMNRSIMVGDRFKDMVFGRKLGLKTIFVLTGYGLGEYTYQRKLWPFQPDLICENLYQAALEIKALH
jgi:D-glycero-D-manno-heptose 1,7-bisphosphate phosphatase